MKDKILNTFSVKSNGEVIEINTIQTEKGIVIKINGTTMDVAINDEIIYSKFDKPEYKDIPPTLRGFVEKHLCSWGDGIEVKEGKVHCNLEFNCEEYYLRIPTNRAKSKDILISNWFTEYEKIQEYDVEISNAKENYEKLISDIKNIGYKFQFAWDGNEYDSTYELVIPISEFNEENILKCLKLWEDYNSYLEKYINKIKTK